MTTSTDSRETAPRQTALLESGRNRLPLSSLVLAGLALDGLILTPVIWSLARADAIRLWPADQPESLLFLTLPAVLFTGAWGAQAFALRQTRSVLAHLARSTTGALIAALFAFALFLALGGMITAHMVFIAAAGLVLIAALHTNYLGAIRSLIRAGIVERAADVPER